jgi:putative transcription factor
MGDNSWDSVTVLRKQAPKASASRSATAVNAALRSGSGVTTEKKGAGNANRAGLDAGKAARLDNETEVHARLIAAG